MLHRSPESAPAHAGPVTCSTAFQGFRVSSGPTAIHSTEWGRDGMRFGQDSDGNRWQGRETTTV
jgi:hypothetical protein